MSKWVREGECNHCGECCQILLEEPVLLTIQFPKDVDRDLMRARGVTVVTQPTIDNSGMVMGQAVVQLKKPCQYHQGPGVEGQLYCAAYGTPDRPTYCGVWPTHPDQIAFFKNCSYTFKEEVDSPSAS